MRVRLFQHVAFEGPGLLALALAKRGHDLAVVRLDQGEKVPYLTSDEGLIVMGGPMNIYDEEKHPYLAAEKDAIAKAVAAGRPVLGICLGAQLLAAALGARVTSNGQKEIGWMPITVNAAGVKSGWFGAEINPTVFHWHGDRFAIPNGGTLLASSEACAHQAFSVGERALGLQFHLEVGADEVREMLRGCGADLQYSGPFVQSARAIQDGVQDHGALLDGIVARLFG